jgi:ABC-type Fe3+ transport system substrate-binding protein
MTTFTQALRMASAIVAVALVQMGASASAADISPALKQVIAGAQKEGKIDLTWGASIMGGHEGVKALGDAMNAMYGTKINVRFTPGPALPEVLNAVVISQGSGRASPTDAIIGTNQHAAEAYTKGISVPVNWKELLPARIQDSSIEAKGAAIRVFTTLPGGIIYNTEKAPSKPTKLADLLKPEWKGKIASTPYAASWELISASDVWGETKALDFARQLTTQLAGLIRCNELERIATGEFLAFAMDCTGRDWVEMQRKKAPVAHVVPEDFPAQRFYYMAIPKNAASPNAAKLFVTFLHTTEGQKLIYKWSDTDLHTYADSEVAKEVKEYEQRGVKFRQYTVEWHLEHPEALAGQRKAVPILAGR